MGKSEVKEEKKGWGLFKKKESKSEMAEVVKDIQTPSITFECIDVSPNNKIEIGSADMLLSQLPALAVAGQLNNAYKIIFPAGITGQLMTMQNGLQTTGIIKNSRIVGQAGLHSLSSSGTFLVPFAVMSIITGQYFMTQINQTLTSLSETVDAIHRQNDASKEAVVFSSSTFIKEIKNKWNDILESQNLKQAYLSNIITKANDIKEVCYYFGDKLNSLLSKLKSILEKEADKNDNSQKSKSLNPILETANKIKDSVSKTKIFMTISEKKKRKENKLLYEIQRSRDFLKYACELHEYLMMLQIFLTKNITKNNVSAVKNSLKKDSDLLLPSVKQLNSIINEIDALAATHSRNEEKKFVVVSIKEMTSGTYYENVQKNIYTVIDRLVQIDEHGQVFYIEDGKLYAKDVA